MYNSSKSASLRVGEIAQHMWGCLPKCRVQASRANSCGKELRDCTEKDCMPFFCFFLGWCFPLRDALSLPSAGFLPRFGQRRRRRRYFMHMHIIHNVAHAHRPNKSTTAKSSRLGPNNVQSRFSARRNATSRSEEREEKRRETCISFLKTCWNILQ